MKTIEINLLPSEYASEKSYSLRSLSPFVLSFLILVLLALNVHQLISQESALNHRNQSMMQGLAQFGPFKQKIERLRKRTTLLNQRRNELAVVVDRRITWSDKLSQIYVLIPPEVWLTAISIERKIHRQPGDSTKNTPKVEESQIILRILGEAKDITRIAELIARLETLSFLEKPRFSSINQKELGERLVMSFEITAQVRRD